jgi:group I intron endonuclease
MKCPIIIGIYKITSPTGGVYIGYTTNKTSRWGKYRRLECNRQRYIYNSLKKHGVENHFFEMVYIFDKGNLTESEIIIELKKLEVYYIDLFKSFIGDNKNGMNLTRGGDGGEISEETKEKLRVSYKKNKYMQVKKIGEKNPFFW